MQQVLTALLDLNVAAVDGDIGTVHDVLFEDAAWTIRYLVVDTGKWLPGRKVLISPVAMRDAAWGQRRLNVRLTRDQVKGSPDIDTDKPVSRQHERAYFDYYGYPYYWAGPLRWGPVPFPPMHDPGNPDVRAPEPNVPNAEGERLPANPHLRSAKAVIGYGIEAIDGAIGHIEDFIYEEEDWSIEALGIDTRNWLPGRHVVVPVARVEAVRWDDRTARVGLTQDAVRQSAPLRSQQIFTPIRDPDPDTRVAGRRKERGTSPVKFIVGLLGTVLMVGGIVLSALHLEYFVGAGGNARPACSEFGVASGAGVRALLSCSGIAAHFATAHFAQRVRTVLLIQVDDIRQADDARNASILVRADDSRHAMLLHQLACLPDIV